MADENINYGEWKVPTSWDELTLKQFQDIEEYYSDKDKKFDIRDVIHIFTNRSIDEVNALPLEFLDKIMSKTTFLEEPFKQEQASNKIKIDDEVYTVHFENKLKVGEYVAADTIVKTNSHNYAALLAILCRKEGEIYDSKFENEVLDERIKMWERQPVTKVMPIVSFFLLLYATSQSHTLLSLRIKELLSLTRKDIETLHKNGEISKLYMRYAMRKLKKWEKSINSI